MYSVQYPGTCVHLTTLYNVQGLTLSTTVVLRLYQLQQVLLIWVWENTAD
jgi:hypothetical protein